MPKSCPACGRPNAPQALRCLYCTEPLGIPSPTEVVTRPPDPPSPPSASESKRHLIILAPQPDDVDGKAQPLAEALGLPLYDARLALAAKRYRLLRKVEDAQTAESLSARLAELGIAHFDVAEAAVVAFPVVSLRWLELGEERIEQGLASGEKLSTPYSQLLLLVSGEITRERYKEKRVATTRGASRSLTPGHRLHLYVKDGVLAGELNPEHFDWGALGDNQSPSVVLNCRRLADAIRRRVADLEVDRGFEIEPVLLSRSPEVSELESMLAGSDGHPEGVIYDNEDQFRFYSRWRYLVARAEREKARRAG